MDTFVISDLHLDHPDVILHYKRPWCTPNPEYDILKPFNFRTNNPLMVTKESLQAHNQALVDNWNSIVGKKDRVIIVGDFAYANHSRWASALNGRKVLILGNHDDMNQDALKNFSEVFDFGCVKSIGTGRLYPDGKVIKEKVTFCHYSMRSWLDSWDGTAALHGHSHGRMPELDSLLTFDVGVDVWGYIPIPWEAIQKRIELKREIMQSRNINPEEGLPRGTYASDPEARMLATRERNLAVLKSIGIDIGPDSVALPPECIKAIEKHAKAERMISSVIAVADTANIHGIMYTRDGLRKIADGKSFFWNEKSGQLSVRFRAGILGDHNALVDMFRHRLSSVDVKVFPDQTQDGSQNVNDVNNVKEEV